MACDLTDPGNPANPLYVARLGPAADYVLLQDAGFDPVAEHKVSGCSSRMQGSTRWQSTR